MLVIADVLARLSDAGLFDDARGLSARVLVKVLRDEARVSDVRVADVCSPLQSKWPVRMTPLRFL